MSFFVTSCHLACHHLVSRRLNFCHLAYCHMHLSSRHAMLTCHAMWLSVKLVPAMPCCFLPSCCKPGAGGLLAADILAPPEVMKKRLYSQVDALWGAVRQRSIFLPAVFVFLWQVRLPTLITCSASVDMTVLCVLCANQ